MINYLTTLWHSKHASARLSEAKDLLRRKFIQSGVKFTEKQLEDFAALCNKMPSDWCKGTLAHIKKNLKK